jgi:hypothetical protein
MTDSQRNTLASRFIAKLPLCEGCHRYVIYLLIACLLFLPFN